MDIPRTETIRRRISINLALVALLLFQLLFQLPLWADSRESPDPVARIWALDLQGAIGPAVSDLFTRSLAQANAAGASMFVLRLNTPGGLDQSMRAMISAILASRVPVAVYVSPQGARAASAGTYILYSAHVAAMAPATNLGAATPVQLGSPNPKSPPPDQGGTRSPEDDVSERSGQEGLSTLERKQINDSVAYIVSLAELRGRNAEWAEKAVRSGASLTARQALQEQVIDLVVADLDSLIDQLDGRVIEVDGESVTLHLQPHQLVRIEPDWRNKFLAVITDPNIAYILLLVGIYGIMIEVFSPGSGVPGIIGGICLLTALYALQLLPINYAALGLVAFGIALMIAEAMSPSFGVMGIGGGIAFIVGSIMLMDTEIPDFKIAAPVIAALSLVSVAMAWIMLRLALKSRKQPTVSGLDELLGWEAVALEDFDREGPVLARGEVWRARSGSPVKQGQKLRIKKIEGLTLTVEVKS